MAKRERDGWRVTIDKVREFEIENDGADTCWVRASMCGISVSVDHCTITPARALQFAAKLQAIAERAAKKEER